MDWKTQTYNLEWLKNMASQSLETSAIRFLKGSGIMPWDLDWKRGNAIPRTLDPNAIPASYLAEVAFDWDKDGASSAKEFIDAIEFEVRGTEKNELAALSLGELDCE